MKKILAIVPVIALVIGFSSMASAHSSDPNLAVTNSNKAKVINNISSSSDTGDNFIRGPRGAAAAVLGQSSLGTGAASATSQSQTTGNGTSISATAPTVGTTIVRSDGSSISIAPKNNVTNTNTAFVKNNVSSDANSGNNKIIGSAAMTTGDASSSSSSVTLLNSSVIAVN